MITHAGAWDPMRGVAFSFWAALSALSGLGLRYPLSMLPLLLLQLFYKSVWLVAVAIPLRKAEHVDPVGADLINAFSIGVVLDLLAIPWSYVLAHYVKRPGDRWK